MNALEKKIAKSMKKRKSENKALSSDKKEKSTSSKKLKKSKSTKKEKTPSTEPKAEGAEPEKKKKIKSKSKKKKSKHKLTRKDFASEADWRLYKKFNKAVSKQIKKNRHEKKHENDEYEEDEGPEVDENGNVVPTSTKDLIPKGYTKGQIGQYTPEQTKLFEESLGHVGPESITSRLASGDQSYFAEMEAPALKQFNDIQAGIANRFSGGGGGPGSRSSRRSSGHQNAQTAAGQDFLSRLQGERLAHQRQAFKDLNEQSNALLEKRPVEKFIVERPQKVERDISQISKKKEKSGIPAIGGSAVGAIVGHLTGTGVLEGAKTGHAIGSEIG